MTDSRVQVRRSGRRTEEKRRKSGRDIRDMDEYKRGRPDDRLEMGKDNASKRKLAN